jgi:hypothetical protein
MTARAFPCAVCGEVLYAQTDTTEDPEAPELVRFEAKPWIGIVLNSVDDLLANQARLLVLCSSDCKNTFFRNGG